MATHIHQIDWFSNVGLPVVGDPEELVQVTSWAQACESCEGRVWDDVQLDASNNLTAFLSLTCRMEYRKWNTIVNAVKTEFEPAWAKMRRRVKELGLPVTVIHCVQWDTCAAAAEQAYLQWNPPFFFARLMRFYESGHFPCGWVGDWPDGKLLVF